MIKNLLLFIPLGLFSCAYQADRTEDQQDVNKFNDPVIQKIVDWQDRRMMDSLLLLLEREDHLYRKEAALAFASVQDKKAIPALADLLDDESEEVRKMAAYALGQTYDSTAFNHLIEAYREEKDPEVNYYLLEAAGKTATKQTINELLSQEGYSIKAAEGMAWALYRAGIQNIYNEETTKAALNILDTASSGEAQLAAAHYLARVRDITIPDWGYVVLKNKMDVENPEIRMAVASAYRSIPPQIAASVLQRFLEDEDYRVRVNAIRALQEVILKDLSEEQVRKLLLHDNPNVGIAMAEKLIAHPQIFSEETFNDWLESINNKRIKALLFQAMLKQDPDNNNLLEKIKTEYLSAASLYYKAGLLQALSESLKANGFIITETFKAKHPVVTTAGISAIAALRSQPDFPDVLKPAFADVLRQAIESGDAAMIDIASAAIRNPELSFKEEYESIDFLMEAKKKLQLPKENETLQSLEKTIAYMRGLQPEPVKNEFNNPINWQNLKSIENRQEAVIKTNKGDIDIFFYTNEAPGSVLNFIRLAEKGYYNNKVFHRVVPNFVVQGGGNRGDGWGGEDYSIRSEFADLKYTTGTIGMASAGKDTEGTQWFITHSPTPHLDGRYTIFAQVKDGMDVVHHIEVGDTIRTVILK